LSPPADGTAVILHAASAKPDPPPSRSDTPDVCTSPNTAEHDVFG